MRAKTVAVIVVATFLLGLILGLLLRNFYIHI